MCTHLSPVPTSHETCKGVARGRAALVGRSPRLALANPCGCTEEKKSTRSEMELGAPTRQVTRRLTPEQQVRCSKLLIHQKKGFRHHVWRCILSCMKTRKKVVLFRSRKQDSATLRPKHLHHWYKSLAGGFRCACEVWRCEFTKGGKDCDIAAEQGRRYCLAHLAFKPQ